MKQQKPTKEEFSKFCIQKMFMLVSSNSQEDPPFNTVKLVMEEYGFNKAKAWSAFRPIFWYLCCDNKIIENKENCWHLNQAYAKLSEEAKEELAENIIKAYGQDLDVRLND